ncbi:hypothetical protein Nham_0342 [Nitrobacter hamburgensis X14]|uniref:Uncharacterized protein n=1 Tax=Nitrobacter hamburgensis (strain DSM 10229 / NCIMB 13809 / X14) TaxID=323097 RepID=Q1QRA9_NITHX|nr:hypothetical protein [Nitrobacter hamburgensis]ABE61238.1 hypothetical protein Nham_0342 [Nitrobacter hamburgensis X14]
MQHANDNTPRTPEQHRAYVASLRQDDDETEVRARARHWPTFGRLKRADRWLEIQTLERYADDEGIAMPEGNLHHANDNSPVNEDGRMEIGRVDSRLVDARLDEENPTADEIAAAAWADEKDRKEGRPEMATRIQFGAYGKIVAVKVRGRYRLLEETFSESRGAEDEKASLGAGYGLKNELPDAQDEAARRMDHEAMKRRLGDETCRLVELACGDATSEEIGEMHGTAGKTAERLGVRLVDIAIGKLMAAYAARDAADREAA